MTKATPPSSAQWSVEYGPHQIPPANVLNQCAGFVASAALFAEAAGLNVSSTKRTSLSLPFFIVRAGAPLSNHRNSPGRSNSSGPLPEAGEMDAEAFPVSTGPVRGLPARTGAQRVCSPVGGWRTSMAMVWYANLLSLCVE